MERNCEEVYDERETAEMQKVKIIVVKTAGDKQTLHSGRTAKKPMDRKTQSPRRCGRFRAFFWVHPALLSLVSSLFLSPFMIFLVFFAVLFPPFLLFSSPPATRTLAYTHHRQHTTHNTCISSVPVLKPASAMKSECSDVCTWNRPLSCEWFEQG